MPVKKCLEVKIPAAFCGDFMFPVFNGYYWLQICAYFFGEIPTDLEKDFKKLL